MGRPEATNGRSPQPSTSLENRSHSPDSAAPSLGLPGHYYTAQDIFEQELNTLWRSTWQMVGRVEDIPNAGDYLAVQLGAEPIFVLRQADGNLAAMHNVCPHRGARLLMGDAPNSERLDVPGQCSTKITCPYHAWTFGADGALLGISQPQQFPDLDKSKIHLTAARVETWGGFIFVCPDLEGESLHEYLADFSSYLEGYHAPWQDLREVMRWSYVEPVNWKFVVENYVEDYHFSVVHPESLGFYDFRSIETQLTGRHCEVLIPYMREHLERESLPHMREKVHLSYQGFIFPNFMVNTEIDHVSIFRLKPLTPTQTKVEVILYQTPQQQKQQPLKRDRLTASYDQVMEEDFSVCRLLQEGVHSRAYGVAQFATERELGISHFHNVIKTYVA
ncbi:MAG: aromatic ring-hydroxylating dioxygenase subunit alpha [Elainellaceae cyanobacterium]